MRLPGLPEAGPGTALGLELMRLGPELAAVGPGTAPGLELMRLGPELAAVGHFVEGPEGKAGPLRLVGRH